MDHLSRILGEPVVDAEEEAFLVFSQDIPSQSLGFIDSQAATLEITIAGRDLTIHQSRGLLTSDRKAGTTGAVWKVTPLFASWIASPSNFLFTNNLLHASSSIIELGAGVSGIVALTLGPRVAKYTATDQSYVLKIIRQNIADNLDTVLPTKKHQKARASKKATTSDEKSDRIQAVELDWETDDVSNLQPVDVIIACDCIYNEALIEPLNSTCASICRLRSPQSEQASSDSGRSPTLCIIAQQLRSPDVFEAWLKSFHKLFEVWRAPDDMLDDGLKEGSGFVVHVGIVR